MSTPDRPQIYLMTPQSVELSRFPDQLARVMDRVDVACLRLSLATRDETALSKAADAVRDVAHARDVMVVIDTHVILAQRLGLDGVHLTDGARSVRMAREALGSEAIVGTFCGQSRHDGMNAGEIGADYVSFGPVGRTQLGDGAMAERDLFAWWTEMIELPIVAEGAVDAEAIAALSPVTDFFCLGEEVWSAQDPAERLAELSAAMQ